MAYSSNFQSDSKAPAFVTKVPHDVVLTQTDTRIFIKNIKTGITLEQFKCAMERYGPVQVYLYEHGAKDNGWAWVGFEDKETAVKAVQEYEYGESEVPENKEVEEEPAQEEEEEDEEDEEEEANPPRQEDNNEKNEEENKVETNSFYAEAEDNKESDDNNNEENDHVKNEESEEEDD